MFTDTQKETLDFIKKYSKKKGYSPTQTEIAKRFRKSLGAINERLQNLEAIGKIRLHKNQRRGIEILESVSMVRIPLLGTIAAGSPIEAIQDKEMIAVPKNKIPSSSEVYALRVVGNSMIDET